MKGCEGCVKNDRRHLVNGHKCKQGNGFARPNGFIRANVGLFYFQFFMAAYQLIDEHHSNLYVSSVVFKQVNKKFVMYGIFNCSSSIINSTAPPR